jgi:hypothetical protein
MSTRFIVCIYCQREQNVFRTIHKEFVIALTIYTDLINPLTLTFKVDEQTDKDPVRTAQ